MNLPRTFQALRTHLAHRLPRLGPVLPPVPTLASTARVRPRPTLGAKHLWPALAVGGAASLAYASYTMHSALLNPPTQDTEPIANVPPLPETFNITMGEDEFLAYLAEDPTGQLYQRLVRTPDLFAKLHKFAVGYAEYLEANDQLEKAYDIHRRVLEVCRRYSDLTVDERMVRLTLALNMSDLAVRLRQQGHAGFSREEEEDRLIGAVYDAVGLVQDLHYQFKDQDHKSGDVQDLDFANLNIHFPEGVPKEKLARPLVETGDLYAQQGKSEGAVACYVLAVNLLLSGSDADSLPRIDTYNTDLMDMDFAWELFVEPAREATAENAASEAVTIRAMGSLQLSEYMLDALNIDYVFEDDDSYDLYDLERDTDSMSAGSWPIASVTRFGFDDDAWQALMVALLEEGSLREMACDEAKARYYMKGAELPSASTPDVEDASTADRVDWESR